MKAHELLAVAVRILGLLLFFVALRDAPGWVQSLRSLSPDDQAIPIALHLAIRASLLMLALFMIKFPATVARMLMVKSDMDSPLLEENGEAIQIAGITIVGVYVLTWAIPDLIYNALLVWQIRTGVQFNSESHTQLWFAIIVTVVEILIGLWCALGAKGMVGVIQKLRS